jgi:crossover junction endodeoxyribonuclease RuvC
MKILGIDVGFAIAGWSIVETDSLQRNSMKLIEYGAAYTHAPEAIEDRITSIFHQLEKVIDEYSPDVMVVEDIFYFKNQKTIINVSQVRGVILLLGRLKNLKIYHYTPLQVKTAVTGYGRAEKAQVQKMVKLIFGLKEIPKPDDAADAIAIAVCHCNNNTYLNKLLAQ